MTTTGVLDWELKKKKKIKDFVKLQTLTCVIGVFWD